MPVEIGTDWLFTEKYGLVDYSFENKERMDEYILIGEIKTVPFNTVPGGWLECDGTSLATSAYIVTVSFSLTAVGSK